MCIALLIQLLISLLSILHFCLCICLHILLPVSPTDLNISVTSAALTEFLLRLCLCLRFVSAIVSYRIIYIYPWLRLRVPTSCPRHLSRVSCLLVCLFARSCAQGKLNAYIADRNLKTKAKDLNTLGSSSAWQWV